MKKIKRIIPIIIAFIIGISTTVGAATVFNSKDITYSSSATTKTNVKDSLDELYTKAASAGQCPEGKSCIDKEISKIVELGDYISMTPTSTSYHLSPTITSYGGGPSIDPSELNLWRVIRKNSDGTIEIISEYVSSAPVTLYGSKSYQNFVGALNTVAAQYTNSKYVQSTRYLGYNGQTEYCTVELGLATTTNCGDGTEYKKDLDLLKEVIGTLVGKSPSGTASEYWIASRSKSFTGSYSRYYGTVITSNGTEDGLEFYSVNANTNAKTAETASAKVRPILILKGDVQIKSGDGTSASMAYQLA